MGFYGFYSFIWFFLGITIITGNDSGDGAEKNNRQQKSLGDINHGLQLNGGKANQYANILPSLTVYAIV
jgi:hypothetical protein